MKLGNSSDLYVSVRDYVVMSHEMQKCIVRFHTWQYKYFKDTEHLKDAWCPPGGGIEKPLTIPHSKTQFVTIYYMGPRKAGCCEYGMNIRVP
jgi:hypothetical protein